MISIKKLKNVNTYEDLCNLNLGRVHYNVSHRGGHIGFLSRDIATHLVILEDFLPRYFGAYCNYLGGGVRGKICKSECSSNMSILPKKEAWLNELGKACIRAYESIENDMGLNETTDENGETNWDALATQRVREAGIKN